MSTLIDFILHIDSHLINIVNTFGDSTYLILFAVIFIETGAVIFPFLPGDSLLFAAAALSANATYGLNIGLFIIIFLAASIGGDSLNFFFGNKFGEIIPRHRILGKFIKEKDLSKARGFFDKYGAMAIFFGRFIPIIRTLIPFVSATSDFPYKRFIKYNLIACISWVAICWRRILLGNIPVVKDRISMVIIGIVGISLIPAIVGYLKTRFASSK